jgi:hypothetical protein
MTKLMAALFAMVFVFTLVLMFAFIFAIITQWAWANSIAQIFHLQELDFWQAFWLNVLGGMVCKGSNSAASKSS